jgi:ribulose-5-phosphate 4-epimerase/fuculose-1-phosphate aldolase
MSTAAVLSERAARETVASAGRRLEAGGLVARTWGNVSVRIDERRMAITPSGIAYTDIGPDQVVVVDLETGEWTGALKPSGERKLHAAIYRSRPDVGAVIHTHQTAASVFAAARADLPIGAGRAGVRCAAYALPGTKKLTTATVAALGSAEAAFMANHGAVCIGLDMDAAFVAARDLEKECAAYVASLSTAAKLPCSIDAAWDPVLVSEQTDGSLLSAAPFTLALSRSGKRLGMVLDDLAQLVGVGSGRCAFIRGGGARLSYEDRSDAEAAAMVVEKACRAQLAGELLGGAKRIPLIEAILMRAVYLKKYSRLKNTSRPR